MSRSPSISLLPSVVLFERSAYYSLLGLLVVYLTEGKGWNDPDAARMVGIFTASVYLAPFAFGFLADRWLGYYKTAWCGSVCLVVGYSLFSLGMIWPSVVFVALGYGGFKMLWEIVNNLDRSRGGTQGAQLGYWFTNLGGAIFPVIAGFLSARFGWPVGLAVSALCALAGFLVLSHARSVLAPLDSGTKAANRSQVGEATGVGALVTFLGLIGLFFCTFQQSISTVSLWAEKYVDRVVAGVQIPTASLSAVNALVLLALMPLLGMLERFLAKRGRVPSVGTKIAGGFVFGVLAFGVLAAAGNRSGTGLGWLLGYNLMITVAEVLTLPYAIGLVGRLAPRAWRGVAIGCYSVTVALGNFASGELGRLWPRFSPRAYWLICAAIMAFGAAVAVGLHRRLQAQIRELDAIPKPIATEDAIGIKIAS